MTDRFALGLDGSRVSTGFALLRQDGVRVQSGAWTLARPPKRGRKTKPDEDADPPGVSWALLFERLDGILRAFPRISVVGYEETLGNLKGKGAASSVFGAKAIIECWAQLNGIDAFAINASALKRWATDSGSAEKTEMIAAARARWGDDCITSTTERQRGDEADALWLAAAVLVELEGDAT